MSDQAPLPDTVAELRAMVLAQQASIAKMVEELAARDDEIERLKAQIDKLRRMHFGRKSEQLAKQIDKLEAQLEDLTGGRVIADHWQLALGLTIIALVATMPKGLIGLKAQWRGRRRLSVVADDD